MVSFRVQKLILLPGDAKPKTELRNSSEAQMVLGLEGLTMGICSESPGLLPLRGGRSGWEGEAPPDSYPQFRLTSP